MKTALKVSFAAFILLLNTMPVLYGQDQCSDTLSVAQFYKMEVGMYSDEAHLCGKYYNNYHPEETVLSTEPLQESADGTALSLFDEGESQSRVIRFQKAGNDHYVFENALDPLLTAENQAAFIGMELLVHDGVEYLVYEQYWGDGGIESKALFMAQVRYDSLLNIREIGRISYCHDCGDLKTIRYKVTEKSLDVITEVYSVNVGVDTTLIDTETQMIYWDERR